MEEIGEYVLGIDLGTNSLGWSIVGLVDGVPARLVRAGVRVFEAGVNIDPKSGKESTRNAQRRQARHRRRQTWRSARRNAKVFRILQRNGLLRQGDASTPPLRQALINELDNEILHSEWFEAKKASNLFIEPAQALPYVLRAAALDEPLEPCYLGRALYHLAQRRGFWSNRKRPPRENEKPGLVAQDIRSLSSRMKAAESRTLGEYYARHRSPAEDPIRGQHAHTSRAMYQNEFSEIWQKQAEYHPELLTDDLRKQLFDSIFHQRKGKLRRGLVGACEFEPEERRAAAYSLQFQRFRLLQVLNNFRYRVRGGTEQTLTPDQRARLIGALERTESLTFKEVRELLGLTRQHSINLQRDKDEAKMPGNDTGAQLFGVFGECWFQFTEHEQEKIVGDALSILSVQDVAARERRAEKYLRKKGAENLKDSLDSFLNITFEDGYGSLSSKAIARFMPLLQKGFPYGALAPHYREISREVVERLVARADAGDAPLTACEEILTAPPERHEPLASLPPVAAEPVARRIGSIRNPIVVRSLTELRKVVNAIVERFGLPTRVHIELLRELKKPKDARERIWKENLARERANNVAEARLRDSDHILEPKARDFEKDKLWTEAAGSGNKCPYCLGSMSRTNLFAFDSPYQVDHIIPRERCLDDSFVNKVLCHVDCNRRKGDRTPWEAFAPENGGDAGMWDRMLDHVKHFGGERNLREEKLRRFKMDAQALEKFLAAREARQFNDAAYASRLAADYMALLYGGRTDAEGSLRVQVRSGGLTQHFREAWNLNSILGDGPSTGGGRMPKPRHDHRHHAIDAAVIAVTDQEMATRLNDAARRRELNRPGRFDRLDEPWSGFKVELTTEIRDRVAVSHRVSKKTSGSFHKDTNYAVDDRKYGAGIRRHRVPLTELSKADVTSDKVIADPGIRKLAQAKLLAAGGDPKKVFAESPLFFQTSDGRKIPIRKVRINEVVKTRQVGSGYRSRFVKPENNHHLEIFAILDPKDPAREIAWDSDGVVTRIEALQRLRNHINGRKPTAIKTDGFGEHTNFKFSIAPGEILECDAQQKGKKLIPRTLTGEEETLGRVRLVVRSISQEEKTGSIKVEMVHITDARLASDIKKCRHWITKSPGELFKWQAKKIIISPLGDVLEAHD